MSVEDIAQRVFDEYAALDAPLLPSDVVPDADPATWLSDLQVLLARWQTKNFGGATDEQIALGVAEEAGELCHAVLKHSQRIRGMSDPAAYRAAVCDALGDIAVYSMQLATLLRMDYSAIIQGVAHEVMERNWVEKPEGPGAA